VTDERVLVVPRERVMDACGWHGVRESGAAACLDVIAAEGRFEPRAAMESDPRFKQVIPYLVLRDRGRFFLMRRTRAGGDVRLHDRCSIGIGGHLNPGDRDLAGGLLREWSEEIAADFVPEFRLLGLLNDDETEVGRVHLGVVYLADAAGRAVRIRETDKLEGDFAEPAAVRAVYDQLETWSRLVLDVVDVAGPGLRDGRRREGRRGDRRT
jgi:predicted NUDIX family phosphoesterase